MCACDCVCNRRSDLGEEIAVQMESARRRRIMRVRSKEDRRTVRAEGRNTNVTDHSRGRGTV